MDPARSSLAAGILATAALALSLLAIDALVAAENPFVFATFAGLCSVGGEPYCRPNTVAAGALTFLWFVLLFSVAWPLLFGGFTWGLPGRSGVVHGLLYGLVLWTGYLVVVVYGVRFLDRAVGESVPLLAATLAAYLVYGLVLGAGYDRFADHRTFLSTDEA